MFLDIFSCYSTVYGTITHTYMLQYQYHTVITVTYACLSRYSTQLFSTTFSPAYRISVLWWNSRLFDNGFRIKCLLLTRNRLTVTESDWWVLKWDWNLFFERLLSLIYVVILILDPYLHVFPVAIQQTMPITAVSKKVYSRKQIKIFLLISRVYTYTPSNKDSTLSFWYGIL